MMKMNDKVKYQLERAEDALRTALKFADRESVYVISAISKALIEIDNTMFAERIEDAVKQGDQSVQGFSFEEDKVGTTLSDGLDNLDQTKNAKWKKHGEMNNTPFLWDNKTEFVPASTVSE